MQSLPLLSETTQRVNYRRTAQFISDFPVIVNLFDKCISQTYSHLIEQLDSWWRHILNIINNKGHILSEKGYALFACCNQGYKDVPPHCE
jgi:hypothetical protein